MMLIKFILLYSFFIFTSFYSTVSASKEIYTERKYSEETRSNSLGNTLINRLVKIGWDEDAAIRVINDKIDYFSYLQNESPTEFDNEIVKLEKLSIFPSIILFLKKHPEMCNLLTESIEPETIAATIQDDSCSDAINKLYLDQNDTEEVDKLAEALTNNRNLICRLLERGFEGSEKLFIFPRDIPGAAEYELWIQDVLNTYITLSDDDFGLIIEILLCQGPIIRDRLNRDENFLTQFRGKLWPKFQKIVKDKPEYFKFYILEPRVWDMLTLPEGETILKSFGILPIDYFFGKNAYPSDIHHLLAQVFLQGISSNDLTLIEAFDKFGEDPLFIKLFRRKLSSGTISLAIEILSQSGMNYPAKLKYFDTLSDIALSNEVGMASKNIFEKNDLTDDIYNLSEKILQSREVSFSDYYFAAEEVVEDALIIYGIYQSASTSTTTNLRDSARSKQILKNFKGKKDLNRKILNKQYAGKKYPLEKLSEKLRKKYPNSVKFDKEGYPDFSPYAKCEVKVDDLTGDYYSDFSKANKRMGFEKTPDGYVWHHHQDCQTLQLVPLDLHSMIRHSGGASMLRNKKR